MTIEQHFENFMSQPEIEQFIDLYENILQGQSNEWIKFYYALVREVTKDRGLFVNNEEQLKEYGKLRDSIETEPDDFGRNCLITALFDALMVEKIKTYSLSFDAPAILADELHDMYLKETMYDSGEFWQ